jgi:hypothetical protein
VYGYVVKLVTKTEFFSISHFQLCTQFSSVIRVFANSRGGADCVYLVVDRDRWWDFVNMVMNVRTP